MVCLKEKIMNLSLSLADKEHQYTSGIVMRANQLLKLNILIKYSLSKFHQQEDWSLSELRPMRYSYTHSQVKIKFNL
jgi:hypothetical protein